MRLLEMLCLSLLQLSNTCPAGMCSWLGCCVLSQSEALRQAAANSRAVCASGACASAAHHSCLLCHAKKNLCPCNASQAWRHPGC